MATADQLYDEATKLKDQGDLDGAVARLREIVAIEPNHVLTHQALGVYLQKLGEFDDAIHHARKVVELEPQDPFSYTQLSVIYQRCGRIPEAEDAMARAHVLQQGQH
ncbi:MAG TPA: tetratricopeptide repeat protein [Planctomycetaceae bacterium]|nr:tetratricopeptide repeat protein [Planctomycetaceae bacterium]